jgi:hypothetical protein
MSEDVREKRNAIFTGGQTDPHGLSTIDPKIPVANVADQLRADFGLDLPVERVPVPSLGLTYGAGHPLSGMDVVEIRGMTAREEDILSNRALLKKGTVITELIRSSLIDRTIDPSSLLNGDRNALMVAIRITGYGADYEAEIECSDCQHKGPQTFNLAELPIRRLSLRPIAEGQNAFEFVLPFTRKQVQFRFLTGRDEEDMLAAQQQQKKLGLGDVDSTNVTANLTRSIISIAGVTDRQKIRTFVSSMMPARDSLALRTYMRENEPGIVMRQSVTCKNCGLSEEVEMPIGVRFLWPHAR